MMVTNVIQISFLTVLVIAPVLCVAGGGRNWIKMRDQIRALGMELSAAMLACCAIPGFAVSARVRVLVLDDSSDTPMVNVRVAANFTNRSFIDKWGTSEPTVVHGLTDVHGCCCLKGQTDNGRVGVYVRHPAPQGYYLPMKGYDCSFETKSFFGVWQPDNLVVTIRLQRIEHPVPLIVKQVMLRDKGSGFGPQATLSFDMLKGDWLPPYGAGNVADLMVKSTLQSKGRDVWLARSVNEHVVCFYNVENELMFPGNGNGGMVSLPDETLGLKIRTASDGCLEKCHRFTFGRRKGTLKNGIDWFPENYTEYNSRRCYVFRIRSRFDEKGRLVGGYYGKIYGDFDFRGTERGFSFVSFRYYLNPRTLDANLEWDCRTNLCQAPGNLYEPFEP